MKQAEQKRRDLLPLLGAGGLSLNDGLLLMVAWQSISPDLRVLLVENSHNALCSSLVRGLQLLWLIKLSENWTGQERDI